MKKQGAAAELMLVPIERGGIAIAPLDPERLEPIAEEAARALAAEGESENTIRSYRGALRYWAAWFGLRYGRTISIPVPAPAVLQFIVDHAQRKGQEGLKCELPSEIDQALVDGGYKKAMGAPALSTLTHRLAVLSKVHQLSEASNPCQDQKVRELLSRTRRAYAKRGAVQNKKAALTKEPLQAMLDTCDDSLRGVRDRALLLFAWSSGGRRRSEVSEATMENLHQAGEGAYTYRLLRSKTNQSGGQTDDEDKPIVGVAAEALKEWLRRSGVSSGAIFRRIRRGGHVGGELVAAAVMKIVKARAEAAGLGQDYSAHSLRSGFVTEAARQGVPIGETMALTGHGSVKTVVGYFRSASSLQSKAARLMEKNKG